MIVPPLNHLEPIEAITQRAAQLPLAVHDVYTFLLLVPSPPRRRQLLLVLPRILNLFLIDNDLGLVDCTLMVRRRLLLLLLCFSGQIIFQTKYNTPAALL